MVGQNRDKALNAPPHNKTKEYFFPKWLGFEIQNAFKRPLKYLNIVALKLLPTFPVHTPLLSENKAV